MTFSDTIPQEIGMYHVIDRNDFGTDNEGKVYVAAFTPRSAQTTIADPTDNYINYKSRSVRDLLWGRMLFLSRFNPMNDMLTMHPQTPSEHKYLGITGRVLSVDDEQGEEEPLFE